MNNRIVVAGLGEIGKPLYDLISKHFETVGVDIDPIEFHGECDIFHVCFPFAIPNFLGACARYADTFKPTLIIINSTVAPGTSREVARITGKPVVNSPVRGKHMRMKEDLVKYIKFIGGTDPKASIKASEHFESIGLKTTILSSPEASELAKLTETTYFGILIAWAQEVERYCVRLDVDYAEVISFYEGISFFPPVKYFPGVIGGHCVMPNIKILKTMFESDMLNALETSNELKLLQIGIHG